MKTQNFILIGSLLTSLAFAASEIPLPETTQTNETLPPVKKARVERIQVTGSHISRVDRSGIAPVAVIDREAIERSGASTIGEVLFSNRTKDGTSAGGTAVSSDN